MNNQPSVSVYLTSENRYFKINNLKWVFNHAFYSEEHVCRAVMVHSKLYEMAFVSYKFISTSPDSGHYELFLEFENDGNEAEFIMRECNV